jgi:hypothetical protein
MDKVQNPNILKFIVMGKPKTLVASICASHFIALPALDVVRRRYITPDLF